MRVIARKTLREFWLRHAGAEHALKAWFHEAEAAEWRSFDQIKKRYHSADVLSGNRVVFNIKGNTYRLVVKVHYDRGVVFIRYVGTHAEYDKIDAATI